MSKADRDNRANQLNDNNDAYHQSRGWESRDDALWSDSTSAPRSWRYRGAVSRVMDCKEIRPVDVMENLPAWLLANHPWWYVDASFKREPSSKQGTVVLDISGHRPYDCAAIVGLVAEYWLENKDDFVGFTAIETWFHGYSRWARLGQ